MLVLLRLAIMGCAGVRVQLSIDEEMEDQAAVQVVNFASSLGNGRAGNLVIANIEWYVWHGPSEVT